MKKIHKFVCKIVSKVPNLIVLSFIVNICLTCALIIANEKIGILDISSLAFTMSVIGILCILNYKNGNLPFITRTKTFKSQNSKDQIEGNEEKQKQHALSSASICWEVSSLTTILAIIVQAILEF